MSNIVPKLISYLLEKAPNAGRTQVVKFLYLADLEARRCLGRPLSRLRYVLDNHGPFDPEILAALDNMEAQGQVASERYQYLGNTCYTYKATAKSPRATFAPEEEVVLSHVARLVGKNSLKKVLDIVYATKPVVEARKRNARGQLLKMTLVDNEARMPGLELERVLASIKELDRTGGKPLEKVLAGIAS
jgi:hypothetical protein